MSHQIGKRIERPATPEEKARHDQIRREIAEELTELKAWARAAAARHPERVPVGTVFTAADAQVITAIDDYAARRGLNDRSAVVREALAQLLGIEIAQR